MCMRIDNVFKQPLQSFLVLMLFLSVFISAAASAATLTSRVDRTTVSADETLTLFVRYSGNKNGQPDFSALSSQFEILNQQESNQFRSINGQVQSYTEWSMVLMPRQPGRLLIPSFKFHGQFSDALEITVSAQTQRPAGVRDNVFIETIVDTPRSYVQEQIRLTYRLYFSVSIEGLDKPDLSLDNVLIEELENSRYQKNIGGNPYQVAEFNYALFPQSSGVIEIPNQTWTAKIGRSSQTRNFGMGGGRYQLKRLKTDAKTIQVEAQPDVFPQSHTWLPSTGITLTEHWSKPLSSFKVGEPITLKLKLQAKGLMSSQLPEVVIEPTDSRVKIYADQASTSATAGQMGLVSERVESMAIVVAEGGEITLPGIKVPWWDTTTNTLQYAEIPERTFLVAAGDDEVQQPTTAPPLGVTSAQTATPITQELNRIWQVLAIIFMFLCLVFAALWLFTLSKLKQSSPAGKRNRAHTLQKNNSSNEKAAWKNLERSCVNNDLQQVREALISWAKLHWPDHAINSLSDVGRLCGQLNVQNYLAALDHAMFSESGDSKWNANPLFAALKGWKTLQGKEKNEKRLPPLYSEEANT